MGETETWAAVRHKVAALVLILIVVIAGLVTLAAYQKKFIPSIPVLLRADRAGLQMHPNNRVKIRGVDIGRVESVALNSDQSGVDITLALDPTLARQVPSNATVTLGQTTAFGNKFVLMQYPGRPSGQFLRAGSVLTADHISTEVNNTFDHLMTLITEIQPSKLNATLGAFAGALQGNGDKLGSTITLADRYLKRFNGNLPALQDDFQATAGFSAVYADATPDLVKLLSNLGVTSATLSDRRTDLHGALSSLHTVGGQIDEFFTENGDPLTNTLSSLRPFTSLLQEYSPEFTCFLDGAARSYDDLNTKGFNEGGALFNLVAGPAPEQYQYPRDLPSVGPGPQKGPNCRGLPVVQAKDYSKLDYMPDLPSARQRTVDNSPRLPQQPAVVQLFGPGALPVIGKGGH